MAAEAIGPATSQGRFWGLSSGLDVDGIVGSLMQAARVPYDRTWQDRQVWAWRQEDFRQINSWLRDLRDVAFDMKLEGKYLARSATSDVTGVGVTAQAGATPTSYVVRVNQVAKPARVVSGGTISQPGTPVDPGATLKSQEANFNAGVSGPFDFNAPFTVRLTSTLADATVKVKDFSFDPAVDSLNSVLAAIKADPDLEVNAYYDAFSDKVVLESRATGSTVGVQVDDLTNTFFTDILHFTTGAGGAGSGQNAQVQVENKAIGGGFGPALDFATNVFTANGLTITLDPNLNASPGTPVDANVSVAADTEAVFQSIQGFVDTYNDILAKIRGEYDEPRYRDFPPLTDAQKAEMRDADVTAWEEKARSGMLHGDPLLARTLDGLRAALQGIVSGARYTQLAEIGITTGTHLEGGKLHVDEAKLRASLASDPEGVAALLATDAADPTSDGLVMRLYDSLTASVASIGSWAGSSGAAYDPSFIGDLLRGYDERLTVLEDRLARQEDLYYRQFTLLEQAMSQFNAQGAFLAQNFSLTTVSGGA